MSTLRDTTLLFLVKKSEGQVTEVCLAMKKRGFGVGRWNGVGGKVDAGESVVDAARREAQEEIGVRVVDIAKVAELSFYFPHNPAWDQLVHVYLAETWKGEPQESEEMRPRWYPADEPPFADMWPDDPDWLPHVLAGKIVRGRFSFGEEYSVLEREVQIVKSLA